MAGGAGCRREFRLIAVDTNLLLYALDARCPEHEPARNALDRASATGAWGFSLVSAVEFWSWSTRRQGSRSVASVEEAAAFLASLLGAGAQLFLPPPSFGWRLIRSALQHNVLGKRIFDWQIGLLALDHGAIELWTHDRGFLAPPGLRVVDPLA